MTRERECLIHIGTHKTGTSLFQQILFDHPAMRPGGASVYPRSCIWPYDRSHNLFGVYFWDRIRSDLQTLPFESVAARILAEADGADRVVISSELLEKCPLRGNDRVGQFVGMLKAGGFRVTILYAVRRQDHLARTRSSSNGFAISTRDFAASRSIWHQGEARDMNFARIAAAWQGLGVDRVKAIPYRRGRAAARCRRPSQGLRTRTGRGGVAGCAGQPVARRLRAALQAFREPVRVRPGNWNDRLVNVIAEAGPARGAAEPRLTMFSPERRAAYLGQFEDDWAALRQGYDVDLSPRHPVAGPGAALFKPLEHHEVARGLAMVAEIDSAIAKSLRDMVASVEPASVGMQR